MNLITRKELYGGLYWELYGDLYGELYGELRREVYGELYLEVYRPLGFQIRIDFHITKFRGYNAVCYK
jgi:hypothetical protein